jgi:hypothetical protein
VSRTLKAVGCDEGDDVGRCENVGCGVAVGAIDGKNVDVILFFVLFVLNTDCDCDWAIPTVKCNIDVDIKPKMRINVEFIL